MQGSFLKLTAPLSILAAILLFCVIFGGYTSFYRSENRIEDSKTALVDACRARIDLLPDLLTFMEKKMLPLSLMEQAIIKAETITAEVLGLKPPLEEQMTKKFEAAQTDLTVQIKNNLAGLNEVFDAESKNEFEALKQKLFKAQDNVYTAKDTYNEEVSYFNMRIESFPVSYIAKLFGFNKIIYYPFSEQAFLPAQKTFEP